MRRATTGDALSIASVLRDAFAPYEPQYTAGGFAATVPEADVIRARFHEGPVWVALRGEAIVGTVAAVLKDDGAYVRSMAIAPDARGHGLGAQLLEQVEHFARRHGMTRLFLSTTPFLDDAIRLYERHGFRRTTEGPRTLFGTPLFTMEKPLPCMRLPADFTKRIIDVYSDRGREWLARLPFLVDELCSRWRLLPGEPYELSYNFVMSAAGIDGPDAVLKLGVPGPALRREMDALAWFDGQASVRLLAADAAQGAMLLERLSPGTRLSDLEDDDEETAIAAGVMASLWKPAPPDHAFPTTNEWTRELGNLRRMFSGDTGPLPRQLVERAEHLFAELAGDGLPLVVLHGDLHHENILAAERRPWLAIDPKGVVGEPAYEAGAFLRNPMTRLLNTSRPQDVVARRIDVLTERLGLDRPRLRAFAFAQLILSAWWMYEDHGDGWQPAIALAETIEPAV